MGWRRALLGGVAITALLSSAAVGVPTSTHVRFAAAGDLGSSTDTVRVLDGVDAAGPDAFFALGDLSYGTTGAEQAWCDLVTGRLGAGYPFQLLAGNHESNGQNGNINDFAACLPNQLPGAVGTYGRQYHVDVPQQDPLVRFIMVSPGLTFPDGTWSYDAGTARYAWVSDAIDQARSRGVRWVVVGMHFPCLSPGMYACTATVQELVHLLLVKKVDLVLSGHEHLYARTEQLALGPGCAALTVNGFDPDCVEDADDELLAGAGTVFLTIGTGGRPLRDANAADPEIDYFAAYEGANTGGVHGFGSFDLTPDTLTFDFTRATDGGSDDRFTITRDPNPPPPNELPTAAFTSTPSGLTASFDATGSSDPDGVVTSYSWDFGDGQTGGGRTTSHTYANAGTYDVTLTVTDDDGGTDSVTQPVTVTAPAITEIARDTFARTIVNAWGTADVGGAWTVPTGNGISSVADGTGRLVMRAGGARPVAVLDSVLARDIDVRYVLALDKRSTPTSSRVDQTVLLRRNGSTEYRGQVRVLGTGAVQLGLIRVVGGTATQLGSAATVPGLTYQVGEALDVRTQVVGTAPAELRMKLWRVGTTEPAGWTLVRTDATASLQVAGRVGLASYLSSGATNAPLEARFDDLVVTPLP